MTHSSSSDTPTAQQRPLRRARTPLAALALLAAAHATALAQDGPRNLLALGVISVPEFEGSADRAAAPLLLGRLDLGRHGSLRLAGPGLQYNLLGAQSAWAFGPTLSFRAARDADVEDAVVQRLREVDGATEVGAFVEYGVRDSLMAGDRFAVGAEAKGGKGNQFSLGLAYQAPRQGSLQLGMDARAVWANDAYMDRYFSVDADNSARSGLPTYTATGGIKNISLGITASYDIASTWALIGRVGLSRLLGDARDSPIVQLRGDANAVSAGLALGYRF